MKVFRLILIQISLIFIVHSTAQQQGFVHQQSDKYTWPTDEKILEKLDNWQDAKFGVLFHWGLYSVPGIVESWSICSEDVEWISRDTTIRYDDYKAWYWGLINEFNPVDFDPEQWAKVTKDAGMEYMVFTTKHHDGFNLFDTQQTDFSIMHGAFKDNPKADVTKHILNAFREQNFMVGTYFSKPDWHSDYYWWRYFSTPNRGVNYKINRHPERWEKFQQFTYAQIEELMTNYGDVDILWLDGGWVAAPNQDIKMNDIARMARDNQPGLLVVDRMIHGENENYLTPERSIPEQQLNYPWESCITLSHDWGWVPNAPFKSANEVLALLVEVAAKGGNLLLGVGPTPEGIVEPRVVEILKEIGDWLNENGEAIYNTRITQYYHADNTWFVESKDGKTVYGIYLPAESSSSTIFWENNIPKKGSKIKLVDSGKSLKWKLVDNTVQLSLDKKIEKNKPIAFSFER